MQYGRGTSQLAPPARTSRVAERAAPARVACRWAALTLAAASALVVARAATAQTVHHATGRTGTRPAPVSGLAPAPTAADRGADSARTAAARDTAGPAAPLTADSAAGAVTPTSRMVGPPTVPAESSTVVGPSAPNVPGAPNVAGHLDVTVTREDVLAPIVETVGPGSGAPVLHLQVLLDVAHFSPGAISGVWNENTVFAIRAFRNTERLPRGDSADAAVIARLERRTGARAPLSEYTVTAADVRGPFRHVPSGMLAQAKLDCLCYGSVVELLGERFHATTDVLRSLNPDVDLSHVRPGTRLVVPHVDRGRPPAVARLVIDKRESSMRGLDARGATRFYLPVTVGSPGLPSPVGRLRVVEATLNPRYHYDPVVLGEARGVARGAMLPPGPNSPVGVLWAQLSRPHVGLHGTPYPEEVGYTMSHGCVRMANWDARWITPLLQPGLVVDFQ